MSEASQPHGNYTTQQLPPSDIDAEEALIGAFLIDGLPQLHTGHTAWAYDNLLPSDFARDRNQWIFEVCRSLHRQQMAVDIITVAAGLRERKRLEEVGGSAYLGWCESRCPSTVHAVYYAKIVAACAEARAEMAGLLRRGPKPNGYCGLPG